MLSKQICEYLDWKCSYTKKAGVSYKLYLERFNAESKKDFGNIGMQDITKYFLFLKKNYAPATVAFGQRVIKNFFTYYSQKGECHVNPFLIKIERMVPHSHYAITPEEFQKIDDSLCGSEFFIMQKRLVVRFLWETGVRVSELCDLNISDIDAQKPQALIITKKNFKKRWIFWGDETHRLLQQFLGMRLCMNSRNELFIVASVNHQDRITTKTVQRWIKEVVKKAEINKKISPHSFRHGKAHNILDKGGNVKDIQFILGHSENNPISVFSYLRLNEKEAEKRAKVYLA